MASRSVAEPRTLAELQQLTTKEFTLVERYQYHGEPSARRIIRHLIELARAELDYLGESEANSLRDFWYNPTKPILERALNNQIDDPNFDFSRRMSQYLSAELSEQVKAGKVTYRELNILDDSRKRQLHSRHETIEYDKILFCEKDSAYRKLKPISDTYELSLVSGSGWQATALIEDLAYELDNDTTYTLYVLSDYDPTGFRITRDFRRRAEQLGIDIESVTRIGITPEQVSAETRTTQRFSPPIDTEADQRWMAKYGINGRYGLELEAIGDLQTKGKALRRVVVSALRDEIREHERYQRDLNRATEVMVEDAVINVSQRLVQDLESRLIDEAIAALRDEPSVKTIKRYQQQVNALVDVDESRATHDSARSSDGKDAIFVPNPPPEGTLHDAAVNGIDPSPAVDKSQRLLEQRLRERLESGDIDIEELLGLS